MASPISRGNNRSSSSRQSHRECYRCGQRQIPAGATVIDLSAATLLPVSSIRTPHLLAGRGSRAGRIRCQHTECAARPARRSRHRCCPPALNKALPRCATSKPKARLWRCRHQTSHRPGLYSGPAPFRFNPRHLHHGGYPLEATLPILDMPKGAQIVDAQSRPAKPRASNSIMGRLDSRST